MIALGEKCRQAGGAAGFTEPDGILYPRFQSTATCPVLARGRNRLEGRKITARFSLDQSD